MVEHLLAIAPYYVSFVEGQRDMRQVRISRDHQTSGLIAAIAARLLPIIQEDRSTACARGMQDRVRHANPELGAITVKDVVDALAWLYANAYITPEPDRGEAISDAARLYELSDCAVFVLALLPGNQFVVC